MRLASAQKRSDAGQQGQLIHGFGKKIIRPHAKAPDFAGLIIERCDQNNWDIGGCRVRLEPFTKVHPIGIGHAHIKQYEIGFYLLGDGQCIFCCIRLQNVKIGLAQFDLHNNAVGRYIIYHKYTPGHSILPIVSF